MAVRAHTRFLSDDLLEGRGAGTRGEHAAAAYIAGQLKRLGLQPLSQDYVQPVPLNRVSVLPETRLVVRAGTGSTEFQHGMDFFLAAGGPGAFRDFSGDAVFLGAAEHLVAQGSTGAELSGRVIVTIGGPGADAAILIPRWREAGAAGIVIGIPDAEQLALLAHSRGPDRFFVDAPLDDPIWQPELPVVFAGPAVLRALLADTGLPAEALSGQPIRPTALGRAVDARIATSVDETPAANVAGFIPGSDPALRDEFVAFTAHYDHLGIGAPDATGDSIYNGFSDNAAGVAMLLAIADVLLAAPPERSVLFLFFTAEERGLLGATYYTTRPLVPLDRTAAVINLDGGAPPAPPMSWRIAGDSGGLGQLARDVAANRGWVAQLSPGSPNTDYWPFLVRGVPAIFIVPGTDWEATSPERQAALRQRWDHYHQPSDEWSADFPFAGLARYAEFALEVGRAAARPAFDRPR